MSFYSAVSSLGAALLSPFKTANSTPLAEWRVLKPINRRTRDDEDEWPQFVLDNAEVFDGSDMDRGSFTTLLAASDDHRLCVTGRLDRLDEREQQLLQSGASLPARISIGNVQHYAYGQYDSGEIAFWAAGKAGWFEIRPSKRYRKIYQEMVEAIEFLYFIADLYRERGRNRGKNTPIETILSRYVDDPDHECADTLEATERLSKHKHILLELMKQGKEGIGWIRTPMYKYLQELPDDLEEDQLEEDTDATGDDVTPARYAGKGKGKSALRPWGSTHSGKGKGRRTRRDEANGDGLEDEEMPDASPLRDRMSSKRKSEEVEDGDPREAKRSKKRRKGRGTRANDIEERSDESEDSAEVVNGDGPKTGAKGAGRRIPSKHPTKEDSFLSIINATLPSLEPNSTQAGVWQCQFDGCDQLVYDATSDKSRELIREHLKRHAYESQRKIDLIQSEERPYLPVNNLIQRIRHMAQQGRSIPDGIPGVEQPERSISAITGMDTSGRDPWDSKPYPKPITQRY